jgi:hypothetical protein
LFEAAQAGGVRKTSSKASELTAQITPFVLSTVVFGGYLGILNIP